jgi:RNA polymerase sigma-70 factor, ECF subfamily
VAEDFLQAYDENVDRVYGYLAYRLPSHVDASDLTQVTFERAFRAWDSFDPAKASVGGWLVSIAHNALIDQRRRDDARPVLVSADENTLERVGSNDEGGHTHELSEELQAGLQTLGDRERAVIALHYGGDLSGPQIADVMGLSADNVYQLLSRSLRKLRATLDAPAR